MKVFRLELFIRLVSKVNSSSLDTEFTVKTIAFIIYEGSILVMSLENIVRHLSVTMKDLYFTQVL